MDQATHPILHAIDLFGTASFAFSGALRASDRRPDFVGMVILAGATAVGGGVLRDLILQRQTFILTNGEYPLVIVLSVIITFLFPHSVLQRERLFKYFDAIGLGVFSALTASALWESPQANPLSILFIATFAGCAGGAIRDVIINKPSLVLENEMYVTPVVIGAAGLMAVRVWGGGEMPSFLTAMLLATGIRFAAIHRDWRLPRLLSIHPVELPNSANGSSSTDHPRRSK
ncbi:MAG: TRIC cation channel family protein [Thermoguttaceae bacterium]|jgi:uncharacterized membrane protein YeiH